VTKMLTTIALKNTITCLPLTSTLPSFSASVASSQLS
jgi:hypothetical protein